MTNPEKQLVAYSTSDRQAASASCYHRRIAFGVRVFGPTLRIAGIILLVVQLVQSAIAVVNGGSAISINIAIGCTIAILIIMASQRTVVQNAVTKFAARIQDKRFSLYVYFFPFCLAVLILWAKNQMGDKWGSVSSEGSLSEYGTAIAYLLVPVFAWPMAKLFRRQNKRLMSSLYLLLIAGAFFVGMEELSWGQRILGYQEPKFWTERNVQSEFTIHNLDFFQNHLHNSYILVGFLGSTCWLLLRYWQSRQARSQRVSAQSPTPQSPTPQRLDPSYLLPDWPISSFFYPIFIFYTLFTYRFFTGISDFLSSSDQEHWEFVMSLGVLLFVVINFFRQARESDSAEISKDQSIYES